ncbi:MAG TPA: hypothetical protein VF337_00590 [Candidatus Limnocylindrales bacterium]
MLDAWLAARSAVRRLLVRPFRARDWWRALPGDLMGLMIMRGCGIAAPTREVRVGDVTAVLVENPRVDYWFRAHLMPVQAQTMGRYVFAREAVSPDLLAHECEHIRQWERLGPLYLAAYFGSSAVVRLRGKRPYWDNHFEVAARKRADDEMASRS